MLGEHNITDDQTVLLAESSFCFYIFQFQFLSKLDKLLVQNWELTNCECLDLKDAKYTQRHLNEKICQAFANNCPLN